MRSKLHSPYDKLVLFLFLVASTVPQSFPVAYEHETGQKRRVKTYSAAQALKWSAVLTVPLIDPKAFFDVRTDQNCWNVEVPRIDGSLVRVVWRIS